MTQLAFPLLVLAATASPAQAGLVAALSSLPAILLMLPAGALLDRWDRKHVMLCCDSGRAVLLASLLAALLLDQLTLVHLAAVALVDGVLGTFFAIAAVAALPQVVERRLLSQALSVTAVTDHVSGVLGPALSGVLFGIGRIMPFTLDVLSYLVSAVSLWWISGDFQAGRDTQSRTVWADMAIGIRWLWQHPALRDLTLLDGGLNLCSMGYTLIIIVRAQELGAGSVAVGLLFATGPLGGIAGALLTPRLQRRVTFGRLVTLSTWVWAMSWAPYALAPSVLWLGLANVVGWLIIPVHTVSQTSYRLAVVPVSLQGRIASVYKLLAYGSQPVSLALTGWLLQTIGPASTIGVIMAPQVVLALWISRNAHVQRMPKLADMQLEATEASG